MLPLVGGPEDVGDLSGGRLLHGAQGVSLSDHVSIDIVIDTHSDHVSINAVINTQSLLADHLSIDLVINTQSGHVSIDIVINTQPVLTDHVSIYLVINTLSGLIDHGIQSKIHKRPCGPCITVSSHEFTSTPSNNISSLSI